MADYPALRAEIDKARGLAHALQQDTQTHSAAVLSQSRADAIGNALLDMCAMAASGLARDKEGTSGGRWEYVDELHRRLNTARNALEDERAAREEAEERVKTLRAERYEAKQRAERQAEDGPRREYLIELQQKLDGQRDARVHAEKRAKDLKGLLFRSEQDLEVERAESKRLREELREYQKAAQQTYNRMHDELREYRKAAQLTAALPYRGGKKP